MSEASGNVGTPLPCAGTFLGDRGGVGVADVAGLGHDCFRRNITYKKYVRAENDTLNLWIMNEQILFTATETVSLQVLGLYFIRAVGHYIDCLENIIMVINLFLQ